VAGQHLLQDVEALDDLAEADFVPWESRYEVFEPAEKKNWAEPESGSWLRAMIRSPSV